MQSRHIQEKFLFLNQMQSAGQWDNHPKTNPVMPVSPICLMMFLFKDQYFVAIVSQNTIISWPGFKNLGSQGFCRPRSWAYVQLQ